MSHHSSRHTRRTAGLIAALALVLPALSPPSAGAEEPARAPATSAPLTLWAPAKTVIHSYERRVWSDLGIQIIAENEPLELWSTRSSYDEPIRTEWRSSGGAVSLPEGSMRDFNSLSNFFTLKMARVGSDWVRTVRRDACLNGWSQRVRPEAPSTSPYAQGCWFNPYALGSVQGVQEGWASPALELNRPLWLKPGRYRVTASITPSYAEAFGLGPEAASRTLTLVVKRTDYPEEPRHPTSEPSPQTPARPAAREPQNPSGGVVADTMPDLRSLPAWSIRTSRNGKYLQFAATVWNAGDSPLVVDGFRRESERAMDAYQYFYDADGNQTGYQQVGEMHWDDKASHQHWHFLDFARYSLLSADQTETVRSRKEAFCLANTDVVDQTVPNADWLPDNTGLASSCGGPDSLSIREVLVSGWGDTYAQYRAGQSFKIEGLPNGTYYIAVIANPENRLVEGDLDNNVSLRKVLLRGKAGDRRVIVPQVGLVVEPDQGGVGHQRR